MSTPEQTAATSAQERERALVEALRDGDEAAFASLVDEHGPSLLRFARTFLRDAAVAEEVVQETWLAALQGIDRFEGRSSIKTWLFRILANRARTRAQREARSRPFSSFAAPAGDDGEPALPEERFLDDDHGRHPGGWAAAPADWTRLPDERLLGREALEQVQAAIERLPERQRAVIALRDLEGLDGHEVAELLDISDGNQRVLLHRARAKVRQALEDYLGEEGV